jgi:hypothetical protein
MTVSSESVRIPAVTGARAIIRPSNKPLSGCLTATILLLFQAFPETERRFYCEIANLANLQI